MRAESKPIPSWEFNDREIMSRPHVDDDARILIDDEAYRIYLDARKRYLAALDMPVRDGIREIYTLCDDLEIDDETASFFIGFEIEPKQVIASNERLVATKGKT